MTEQKKDGSVRMNPQINEIEPWINPDRRKKTLHLYRFPYTINPPFKPQGLINCMVHNHLGSNPERVEIETINLWC